MLPGILHELTGCTSPYFFHGLPYPDRPHFTVFDYETCMVAYRNPEVFSSSAEVVDVNGGPLGVTNSMLSMGGAQHKRYRALVQPSFLPANGRWWAHNWIIETVDILVDGLARDGRAELNVDFFAAIPLLTITGSFGVPDRAGTRDPASDRPRPAEGRRHRPADCQCASRGTAGRPDQHPGAGRTDRRRRRHHPADGSGDRLVRSAVARRRLGHHVEADGHHLHRAAAAAGAPRCGARQTGSCSAR